MNRFLLAVALVTLPAVESHSADKETSTGTGLVNEVRYELQACDKADTKRPGYTIYDHVEAEHKFRLVVPNDLASSVGFWWWGLTQAVTRGTTTNRSGIASS